MASNFKFFNKIFSRKIPIDPPEGESPFFKVIGSPIDVEVLGGDPSWAEDDDWVGKVTKEALSESMMKGWPTPNEHNSCNKDMFDMQIRLMEHYNLIAAGKLKTEDE